MIEQTDFEAFPKISRLNRELVITEKIDGTNAQVVIDADGTVRAGSRSRYITPADDNFGFARWVAEHEDELRALGPGRHYGEWWGAGIQRRYGLTEKRFSLFNVHRWSDDQSHLPADSSRRPECCHVVPVLARTSDWGTVAYELQRLAEHGSFAAPGFMKPEGLVIFHTASGSLFKATLEGDGEPKGKAGA